jgi:hypothetical protein
MASQNIVTLYQISNLIDEVPKRLAFEMCSSKTSNLTIIS